MKIIRDYKDCSQIARFGVVALGNFDGVHNGHVAVIKKTIEIAKAHRRPAGVLTFEPHPLTIIKPDIKPFRLTAESQKASLMQKLGIDNLFIIDFTKEFSQIKAADFIKQILVDGLAVSHVVTGEDFIFGHNREGCSALLADAAKEYNFCYTKVLPVGNDTNAFSSSLIRKSLAEGRPSDVRAMLGRNFVICGVVEDGNKKGREIGFPTINISLGEYLRPAFGVYAAKINIEGREKPLYGAANLGIRPTINGIKELLEVHIFDFSENIYGLNVQVELIEYIRPEQKFSGLDALKNQITEDCIKIRNVLA